MSDKGKPMKISLHDDEYETEETTRRAAGPLIFDTLQSFDPQTANPTPKIPPANAPQRGLWVLESVPQLPEYHPLEQTAVFLEQEHPSVVSKRISDVLRSRSIEAVYEDDKAKVRCLSADGFDFRIRLYRGRQSYSDGIIVEVQRRFGMSPTYYKDTMAILDAVQNKPLTSPPSTEDSAIPMVSDAEDDYKVDGASSLAFIAKLLNAGYDSQYLAFQTLVALTNASKMGLTTSRAVSQELLRPGNIVGLKVLDLILSRKVDDTFHLRTLAMTALANAVVAVNGDIGMPLHEKLRPLLLQELQDAENNTRVAQLSCMVLEHILSNDHDAAEFHGALTRAFEAGVARHAGLERQAKRCLDVLAEIDT
jgi:hypothetical protein